MREIIFDTETTGLDPKKGDRLVEIGCIEMVGRVVTGRTYHAYFNPERDMPAEAERVHGLSAAFLADKPLFAARAEEILEFIADSPLVARTGTYVRYETRFDPLAVEALAYAMFAPAAPRGPAMLAAAVPSSSTP